MSVESSISISLSLIPTQKRINSFFSTALNLKKKIKSQNQYIPSTVPEERILVAVLAYLFRNHNKR